MERTLPWSWYTEPDVLRREHERIFRSAWQYVGHVGDLPTTRSYTAARAADVPVLLVRDGDDVRAFLNVCRHRGTQLVDGPAGRETIQCPYHAWTYGLDGALQCAPRSDREPAFEPDGLGLLPLAIERWGPFVFVNPDRNPPPLVDALGPVPGLVRDAGVDVDALVFHHRSQSSYQANWKICCENYLECYHCAVAHPGFSAVMDVRPDAYRLEQTTALVSTQLAPVRANGGSGPSTDGEVTRGQFHFVWPNLTVNIAPGRPNISLGPVLPEGPERTSRSLDFFFAADADPAWIGELLAWDDQVGAEDLALVERVQSGVRAGMLDAGVLLAESEQLVAGFDARIRAALM